MEKTYTGNSTFAQPRSRNIASPPVRATCPGGKIVLGGGARITNFDFPAGDVVSPPVFISGQRPFGPAGVFNAWEAELFNPSSAIRTTTVTVYAICATVAAP